MSKKTYKSNIINLKKEIKMSDNKLKVIQHPEFGEIRTEIINNEPWFCGKDVCVALGYEKPNNAIEQHCRKPYTLKRSIGVVTSRVRKKFLNI